MFTLKIDDVSYGVRFQYRPVVLIQNSFHPAVSKDAPNQSIRTVCQILELDDENRTSELICEGYVTCTLSDNFSKIEGRQRSLVKALDAFNVAFSKVERKAFWEAYFANHKDLRPKRRIPDAC